MDSWSFGWVNESKVKISKQFGLSEDQISYLYDWVDKKFESNKIGYPNIFYSLEELKKYKNEFFTDRDDLIILGLSFSEKEANDLIEEFKPQEGKGGVGIRYSLNQKNIENPKGKFIVYEIIGINYNGDFHTIHCHDLQNELETKFGLEFFENGLVKTCKDWKEVTDYCNEESNGLEPVPWFFCKVKLYE